MRRVAERQYDLALFGATGFTGGLTAEYLAANAPEGLSWALVGRNRGKLEAVRARLASGSPDAPVPDLIEADAADRAALDGVAESARVVDHHGRPLRRSTASRWSPPAPPPAPTTSTSPASPSSSTGCGSRTTPRPSGPAPGSSTAAASTRSRTTSAPTSRSSSCPRGCR